MEKITDKIRAKYPNPIQAWKATRDNEYCVLGAACMYFKGRNFSFPTPLSAAGMIGITRNYAYRICVKNDTVDFDAAWNLLEEALQNRKTQ